MRLPLVSLLVVFAFGCARADDAPLRKGDVIALVGGEDMVVAAEYGCLESLLQRALPDYHLKVRSLAWEGDSVFEQPRDLNYPPLERQLDDMGATLVIVQFGQVESLSGVGKLPEFAHAYETLVRRIGAGKRRVLLVSPHSVGHGPSLFEHNPEPQFVDSHEIERRNEEARAYEGAVKGVAEKNGVRFVSVFDLASDETPLVRDGVHWTRAAHRLAAEKIAEGLGIPAAGRKPDDANLQDQLAAIIASKNRLWFHYYRPQNWSFLAGDRTEQPSSRDHINPSIRWFPEEMKQWPPLVEARDKEIWAFAAKAAKGESAKDTDRAK